MPSKNHSIASVLSRHPIHGISEFADTTARNAHVYLSTDVGKVVQTGTGSARRYWLAYHVSSGVASFREVAPEEVPEVPLALGIYFPDAAPTSPHATNDEFTGGTLDPKHLIWDPASIGTWTVDTTKKMAKVTGVMSGTQRIAGLIQQLPASECVCYGKAHGVFHAEGVGTLLEVGLAVTGNVSAAPTTEFAHAVTGYGYNNATYIGQGSRGQSWSTYATAPTGFWEINSEVRTYFRIRRNGLSVWFDTSPDGVTWFGSGPQATIANLWGFGPVVAVNDFSGNSAKPWAAYFKFIRAFSGAGTSGFNSTSIGRYI